MVATGTIGVSCVRSADVAGGKDPPCVSVVIVSYNTCEMTLECLRSVFAETRETSVEVILWDNASTDGSGEAIEREFLGITLIRSVDNLGFARANNVAALQMRGEYLLLLNPDTVVLNGAIDRLVEFARRRPEAMIWGGRTVDGTGALDGSSVWRRMTLWSSICRMLGLSEVFAGRSWANPEAMPTWGRDSEREVDIVTGCFLLIRRELWERLGGFDTSFFMYGEEADLCLRARTLGARPMFTPEATIVHYGGASERVRWEKVVRLFGAKARLMSKHWGPVRAWLGVRTLEVWAWSRYMASSTPWVGARTGWAEWKEVWRARDTWRAGAGGASPAGESGVEQA